MTETTGFRRACPSSRPDARDDQPGRPRRHALRLGHHPKRGRRLGTARRRRDPRHRRQPPPGIPPPAGASPFSAETAPPSPTAAHLASTLGRPAATRTPGYGRSSRAAPAPVSQSQVRTNRRARAPGGRRTPTPAQAAGLAAFLRGLNLTLTPSPRRLRPRRRRAPLHTQPQAGPPDPRPHRHLRRPRLRCPGQSTPTSTTPRPTPRGQPISATLAPNVAGTTRPSRPRTGKSSSWNQASSAGPCPAAAPTPPGQPFTIPVGERVTRRDVAASTVLSGALPLTRTGRAAG